MARRSDHSRDELRKMTLNAAGRIIAERGLDGLSIRGIAQEIGYTSGTLYQLFRNLDDLIIATHILTLQDLHSELLHVHVIKLEEGVAAQHLRDARETHAAKVKPSCWHCRPAWSRFDVMLLPQP